MSSTQEGSSGGGCSSQQPQRPRRVWTQREEVTLIAALKELIAQGWKSDNGYKAGYLNRLEDALQKEYPGCDLKASPHVHSRLASWKKSYNSLAHILSKSGAGFSPRGNHMIEVDDAQWEQILKEDSNARCMRYKQWPYYEDWKVLFGKDRANGENAEDIYEAYVAYPNQEGKKAADGHSPAAEASFENDPNQDEYDQISQSARDVPYSARDSGAKKRKIGNDFCGVCELLAEMNHSTNACLEQLANRIGYEFDMGKARQEVLQQLSEMEGLSQEDMFMVCELVAFKSERLDIWRGMTREDRTQYVNHLLKGRGV